MAEIGSFGDIVFIVSNKKILSFEDFQRNTSPRWKEHNVLSNKPFLEFEGPGADEISFSIVLSADMGINPELQMAKIREFARRGKKALFIRGGKPISINHWVITRAVEKHQLIDNKGNILKMSVDISLKEHVLDKVVEIKKTTSNVKGVSITKSSKQAIGEITIIVKSVHIRSGPGVNYKVLGYAMNGDKFKVYSKKNGWYSLGGGKYITASSEYSSLKKG